MMAQRARAWRVSPSSPKSRLRLASPAMPCAFRPRLAILLRSRLRTSRRDFEKAIRFIDVALTHAIHTEVYEALLLAAVVSYARPFSRNERAKPPPSDPRLAVEEKALLGADFPLHERLLEIRNKAIAHAESEYYPVELLPPVGSGGSGFATTSKSWQPDLGEGRMFLGFSAQSIVQVEKYDVGTVECAPLARSPRAPLSTRRHRFTMKQYRGIIILDIIRKMIACDVVIAEITPTHSNVYYEVGYAHALKKPCILIAEKGTALPFDVSPFRVLMYENTIDGKHQIEDGLRSHLTAIFAENQ